MKIALPRLRAAGTGPVSPWRAGWDKLSLRDKRMALIGLAVVGLFLLWTLAVRPAWQTVRDAPAQMDALDAQLQGMQRLATEAAELRAAPAVSTEQSNAALVAASTRLGERARLSVQGERAVLTLNGIDSEALRGWLGEVRTGARARPIELQLARGAQGYTGTITVTLGGAAP